MIGFTRIYDHHGILETNLTAYVWCRNSIALYQAIPNKEAPWPQRILKSLCLPWPRSLTELNTNPYIITLLRKSGVSPMPHNWTWLWLKQIPFGALLVWTSGENYLFVYVNRIIRREGYRTQPIIWDSSELKASQANRFAQTVRRNCSVNQIEHIKPTERTKLDYVKNELHKVTMCLIGNCGQTFESFFSP